MIRSAGQKSLPAIGFLSVTRDADQSFFGGYLVLNALGRPLEFHCTAPVRPNRAQAVLYGPTLEPYLCGERIGQTLLEKSKLVPRLVLTDCPPVMAARFVVDLPMALVLGAADTAPAADPAVGGSVGARLQPFPLGGFQVAVLAEHAEDQSQLMECWPQFAGQIELDEPFGRIREAIEEARASTR